MMAACEAGDVFALLEGGTGGAREAADALQALYGAVRDPWLTHALLLYHARTGSTRAIDLLARANDLHARFLLDALRDQLRGERATRHHALAAFAPLVARRPPWLHRLLSHPLTKELLRCTRAERDPLPLTHALLALATLLPAAPALAVAYPADLADALMRPTHLEPAPAPPLRAHLHLAQLALFRALYATHPCTLLEALRAHGAELGANMGRDAWERAIAALADSVRLHPALITGSRMREADSARWSRLEVHDVVAEGRRLSLPAREDAQPSPAPAHPAAPLSRSPVPGSGAHAARAASALRPGVEPWFPLAERCSADSAPPTPLPVETDAVEPPEAAVEATPENTPAREPRAQFRFPADSGAVRAIGRPDPTGASAGEAYAARLQRVAVERRAADSPVAFGGTPPPAGAPVARPEPSRPVGATEPEPLNVEDREVLELTRRALSDSEWAEPERPSAWRDRALALDPRRTESSGVVGRARHRTEPPPRRASSCLPSGGRSQSVAVQTVDLWPAPYEFIIGDLYRVLPEESHLQGGGDATSPCERLDAYLTELYAGAGTGVSVNKGSRPQQADEQLGLVHAQLMYERWRREAHAERNRRLLGRCRQVRALELRVDALEERLRAARRERDDLRARLEREAPPPDAAAAAGAAEREARLEAALAAERAARLRAEAALHEAEAQRALDAAELQRTRGESFEAARHVEALARAALAADRRAEHVRRLRCELVVLAERESRLEEAARAGLGARIDSTQEGDAGVERALRAACARAESEAEAASARALAATARMHELEALVAARDDTIARLKRATRQAAEEGAAQLRALHDKYEALMRVVRAAEARRLEWLAMGPPRGPRGACPSDADPLAAAAATS